jgi:uncharacterized protein (UPF0332 family)
LGKRDTIKRMLNKSKRALRTAAQHIKDGDYDFASSKAYYAVFHLLQALLLVKDLTFSKHSAVIAEFNRNYIKPGIFPQEYSKNLEHLFKDRQIGDYDYMPSIDKEVAKEDLEIAESMCDKFEEYLKTTHNL